MINKNSSLQKVIIINQFDEIKRFVIIGKKDNHCTLLPVGVNFQLLKRNLKTIKLKEDEIIDCNNGRDHSTVVCLRRDI